jgi:hypothetical protein
MSIAETLLDRSPVARFSRRTVAALGASIWRHRWLHAMAIGSLLLAIAVGARTGNMPDVGVVRKFLGYLFAAFALFACGLGVFRFLWLMLVERHPAPLGAFFGIFPRFFGDIDRFANGINGVVVIIVFSGAFGVLKGAISILSPFHWDPALSHYDRLLAFGREPFERLWWLVDNHLAVATFNFAYNLWFFLVLGTIFTAAFAREDSALRHRFFGALMLIYTVGGFLIATAFSSAGPCYYARLGFGDTYQPLMDALHAAARDVPVWALATQEELWRGYLDPSSGSAGITAFPSLHVATSMLLALYWQRRSAVAGRLLWGFAGTIYIGSIVLGWHYAVDGIAAALITIPCWKISARLFGRFGAIDKRL